VTATATLTIYEHMFRSFGLKENPFSVSPDLRFLFAGPSYETAIAELMFGIESHRGLLVLTGEAGTGKTTLMRHFLQWLNTRQFSSSYIFHTHLDSSDLFEFILRDFGVPVDSTKKSDLLATLHRWLHARQAEGDSPVIIIDEAQALSLRTLSELNLLLNLENIRGKLVQIVLAGQPELEEKIRRPELRALRQRIMVRCRLPLLSLEETADYIASRLRGAGGSGASTFPPETIETIYSYARGVPRIVNLLCEHALIGAYADRRTVVSSNNVRRVAAEFDLVGAPFQATTMDSPFPYKFNVPPAVPHQIGADAVAMSQPAETPATVEASAIGKTPGNIEASVVADPPVVPAVVEETASTQPECAAPELAEPIFAVSGSAAPAAKPQPPETREDAAALETAIPSEVKSSVPAVPDTLATDLSAVDGNSPAIAKDSILHEAVSVKPSEKRRLRVVGGSKAQASSEHYAWHKRRVPSSFELYWRDVAESFVRDWRQFFASLVPQVSAFTGSVPQHASSLRRKVIAPLQTWLRTPIHADRSHDDESGPSRPKSHKS